MNGQHFPYRNRDGAIQIGPGESLVKAAPCRLRLPTIGEQMEDHALWAREDRQAHPWSETFKNFFEQ